MPQNTSCLLALVLAASSALVAMPSQAQTATENRDMTASSQTSASKDMISKLKKSRGVNQNKAINISQSEPSSVNVRKSTRERIPVFSRMGFGLKQ